MTDARWWKPVADQLRHTVPRERVLLAAPPERTPPEVAHPMPERRERPAIGGHRIIGEVASDDLPQPRALDRDRLMHAPPKLLLHLLELGTSPIGPGNPLEEEPSLAGPAADVCEPEEVEGFRFGQAPARSACSRMAAELDQSGLVRIELQGELFQPRLHRL